MYLRMFYTELGMQGFDYIVQLEAFPSHGKNLKYLQKICDSFFSYEEKIAVDVLLTSIIQIRSRIKFLTYWVEIIHFNLRVFIEVYILYNFVGLHLDGHLLATVTRRHYPHN